MSDIIYRGLFRYWQPDARDAGRGDVVTVPMADLKHAADEIERLRERDKERDQVYWGSKGWGIGGEDE